MKFLVQATLCHNRLVLGFHWENLFVLVYFRLLFFKIFDHIVTQMAFLLGGLHLLFVNLSISSLLLRQVLDLGDKSNIDLLQCDILDTQRLYLLLKIVDSIDQSFLLCRAQLYDFLLEIENAELRGRVASLLLRQRSVRLLL